MKKLIAILLACILLAAVMLVTGCGETIPDNEEPKDNTDDGGDGNNDEAGVTEPSPVSDFEFELNDDGNSYSVTNYIGSDKNVIIPSSYLDKPVTGIGESAFEACSSLTSITIPDSVTNIDVWVFENGNNLESITVAEGNSKYHSSENCLIKTESKMLILGCKNSIIPSDGSVTCIGDYAFYGCVNLTSITIPNSVTSIGSYAFEECYKLIEVYNLSSLNITAGSEENGYVGYYTLNIYTATSGNSKLYTDENGYIFYKDGDTCYLVGYTGTDTELVLPDGCDGKKYEIYTGAFALSETLTSVTIPNSVTGIGLAAFSGCNSLTSITIPDSVTNIGSSVFYNCSSLTSVTIGNSVTSIGNSAFDNCSSLTSVTIPDSVTSIRDYAFYGCSSLTSITIPDSVTSIGKWAFSNCSSFTSVHISDIATWCAISFDGSYSNPLCYAKKLYLNGSLVTELVIPEGTTIIGKYAFYGCYNITSITIPNSVTSIGYGAFSACSKLVEVYNLSSLNITAGSDENGYVGYYALGVYTDINTPSKLWTNSDGYIFYENGDICYLIEYTGDDTELILPDSCNGKNYAIYKYAFEYCSSLTSVTIPNSVTSIGDCAFCYCSGLTSVTIGNSVTSIGGWAFSDTGYYNDEANWENGVLYIGKHLIDAKTSISGSYTIKDGTLCIAGGAFRYCDSLTSITIPNGVTSIENSAFYNCIRLVEVYNLSSLNITAGSSDNGDVGYYALDVYTDINTPSKLWTSSGGYIFYEDGDTCYLIGYTGDDAELTLPDSCDGKNYAVYKYAFYYCRSLTSITIPNSVTSIGDYAFYYCSGLTTINYTGSEEEWNAISKGSRWYNYTGSYTIVYNYIEK